MQEETSLPVWEDRKIGPFSGLYLRLEVRIDVETFALFNIQKLATVAIYICKVTMRPLTWNDENNVLF